MARTTETLSDSAYNKRRDALNKLSRKDIVDLIADLMLGVEGEIPGLAVEPGGAETIATLRQVLSQAASVERKLTLETTRAFVAAGGVIPEEVRAAVAAAMTGQSVSEPEPEPEDDGGDVEPEPEPEPKAAKQQRRRSRARG